MKNLAVINTQTHEVKVFNGREQIAGNTFNTSLEPEQVEAYRSNPAEFLGELPRVEEPEVA